ncbi:hypothetical protein SKDZ_04G0540 [Saccharomyces kudriavzevii ZP591]|nr:hypothetical protein SKDZ_04G0540 [Saccharomyces kudriavzevii ZP591]
MAVLGSENWGLTPAMETGLFQKPQDRIFIIELENSIVSFINSNTESFQLRPMNSYYRLLSHQIAEYHNLNHVLARTQDSCVILFKGENFQKGEGKPLLQELQLSKKSEELVFSNENIERSNNSKIFRILKRKEVRNDSDFKLDSGIDRSDNKLAASSDKGRKVEADDKSSTDLEQERIEKERLYEQRKQEIFDKLNKNEDDGKSTNSSSSNDSDNEWSDWLDSDDTNTQTTNGSISSPSPFNPYMTTTQQNKPQQLYHDNRRGRGQRRRGTGNHKDAYRCQNRRNKENGGYQAGYPTPYMVYPPPQIGNNTLSTYPLMYSSASSTSAPAPMMMSGNGVFMNPYMYNMNPQTSCSFSTPMPMYPSYQYQYQYPYNPQYQNGSYGNTSNYNSNGYTKSLANKFNQSQRKNPSSSEGLRRNNGSNSEGIRRGSVKDIQLSEGTNSIEAKLDKLNISSEK